jgi:site-specific DNA-adenine methylase
VSGLRPFFPYFGSKWLAARAYPPPVHRQIVEPFAGSAGFGLAGPTRDFVGFHLNPGNTIPGRKRSGFRSGRWNRHWSSTTRANLAQQLSRIRHWRVIEGDYSDALTYVQGPAAWFVDPPYSNSAGKTYRTPPLNYGELAAWVEGLHGQVIVCEHDGADWLPFRAIWSTAGVAGESREAVYVRYSEVRP